MSAPAHTIVFTPSGRRGEVPDGASVLDAARALGVDLDSVCGGRGICGRCQVVPMRVWDTFVVDMNNFGQAVSYAADNGIQVVEGAVGGLFNSRFAR